LLLHRRDSRYVWCGDRRVLIGAGIGTGLERIFRWR